MKLGKHIELSERSALGRRYDDFLIIGALQRFWPDWSDEVCIPWALESVGYWLPWEIDDATLTWKEIKQ